VFSFRDDHEVGICPQFSVSAFFFQASHIFASGECDHIKGGLILAPDPSNRL
jgi:hypothetical protein